MSSLADRTKSKYLKLIYIGNSGSGKTGSLVSLLAAGYKFKIIDMDNGMDSFIAYAAHNNLSVADVDVETFRDKFRSARGGPVVSGPAKAFNDAMDQMTAWSEIEDTNTIFVLDSLTHLGKAAYRLCDQLNPGAKDKRQIYFAAQNACESVLALLTSDDFKMNVIVISHIGYDEVAEGIKEGFPSSIGSALNSKIPTYFNTLILAENDGGIGKNAKRRIKTMPTGVINLKIPSPEIDYELPLETGLATIFKALKG